MRTIVTLNPTDKKWLDKTAKKESVPMAEIIRRAIRQYRTETEARKAPSLEELLQQTGGLWNQGDGLEFQRKIRKGWED